MRTLPIVAIALISTGCDPHTDSTFFRQANTATPLPAVATLAGTTILSVTIPEGTWRAHAVVNLAGANATENQTTCAILANATPPFLSSASLSVGTGAGQTRFGQIVIDAAVKTTTASSTIDVACKQEGGGAVAQSSAIVLGTSTLLVTTAPTLR